jgi:hypothetical protein
MLRSLTALVLATLTVSQSTEAASEVERRSMWVICTPHVDAALEVITKQQGEQLVWMSVKNGSEARVLTMNAETQSWSWLTITQNELCVIARGQGYYIPSAGTRS